MVALDNRIILVEDDEDLVRGISYTLEKEGHRINQFIIDNMLSWGNTRFNVYCGEAIYPEEH